MTKRLANHRDRRRGHRAGLLDTVLRPVLELGDHCLLADLRRQMNQDGIVAAVATHDTPHVFDWMVVLFQLQGISDANAMRFTAANGAVGWRDLESALAQGAPCPKLKSFPAFEGCGYRKHAWTCSEPGRIDLCPLPRQRLRNGRLSRNAFAFFLFVRDICKGDLVGWIDRRLEQADSGSGTHRSERLGRSILDPLTTVHGIGPKVASMVLADLLLGADPARERWIAAGAGMIAVDTLVHNFLHRTGILSCQGALHAYGPSCYGPLGCAQIIRHFSETVDARRYATDFPRVFPRFVQHAIWRFCAADGWDLCNGNRIDDRRSCERPFCPLRWDCARQALHGNG